MKVNLALTILIIAQALAENDDAKAADGAEVKSAKTEDDITRSADAESHTVPVEVIRDVVNDSEVVKTAETGENKEDSRVERSTVSQAELTGLIDETAKLDTDSEHVANRRSNEETSTAVNVDETFVKAGSENETERAAKPETESVKDDEILKTADDTQKEDVSVRSADAKVDDQVQSESEVRSSKTDDDVKELERSADAEDIASLLKEGVEDITNFNTRRMSYPLETMLDTKARLGEQSDADEGFLRPALDYVARPLEHRKSFDSHGPRKTQTLLPPLMPVPDNQNLFLTPTLPSFPSRPSPPLPNRRLVNIFPTNPPPNLFKPFPVYNPNPNPFQPPGSFPLFPVTTIRPFAPLGQPLPYPNLPNLQEMYRKAAEDSKSLENFNQFQNNGFNNKRLGYGVPSYLRYV